MKQKLRMFAIHQTAISLQRTNNLNPRTSSYPALNEPNRMNSAYFIIHPGKSPPPQNDCRLKSDFKNKNKKQKNNGSTSSTFPIQPGFSQNQPAAITLNTSFPRTLDCSQGTHLFQNSHKV
jgi:hypothetical protein